MDDKSLMVAGIKLELESCYEYIKTLEKQLKWISTKERFPDKGDYVMTYCQDHIDCMTLSYSGEEWIETDGGICPLGVITHWMPLPAAPEDTNEHK